MLDRCLEERFRLAPTAIPIETAQFISTYLPRGGREFGSRRR